MQCSKRDSKGWRCKKETDLDFKFCYHCRQIVKGHLQRIRKKNKPLNICDRCNKYPAKKGVITCELCVARRAIASRKYKIRHREVINEYNRIRAANWRAGRPTTLARRQAEVDRC